MRGMRASDESQTSCKEDLMAGAHAHQTVAVESRCTECGAQLGKASFKRADLESVQGENATALPGREAMSLVNANLAVPINIAAALNVLSDGSIAAAAANQNTPISQGMLTNPVQQPT